MIGDVLTSSILFEALSSQYPEAELHYLIQPHTRPVVEGNPFIDTLKISDPEKESTWTLAHRLRKEKYDVVIDVYAKLNSAIVSLLSGAGKRLSYYKWYTAFSYTRTFQLKQILETNAGFAIENRMLLLQGLSEGFPVEAKPRIYLTEKERQEASRLLTGAGISEADPLLMVSILGSSSAKTYPSRYMAEVLDHVVEKSGAQLLFNYIPRQLEQASEIFDRCTPKTQKNIFFDVYGRDLREFMALTSQCDALIGNEGGAVNMAKALEIPTFSIFSPQIRKENWSIYEDGKTNVAIHLRDYDPEIFESLSKKELRKKAGDFYELLQPKLIFAKLDSFLMENVK